MARTDQLKDRANQALSTVTRGRLGTPPQTSNRRRKGVMALIALVTVVGGGIAGIRALNKRNGVRASKAPLPFDGSAAKAHAADRTQE